MTPTKAEALSDAELAMFHTLIKDLRREPMQFHSDSVANDLERLLATIADRDAKIAALRSPPVPEGVSDGLAEWLCEKYSGHIDFIKKPFLDRDHTGKRPWRQDALDIATYMTSAGYVRVPTSVELQKIIRAHAHMTLLESKALADALITALKGPT